MSKQTRRGRKSKAPHDETTHHLGAITHIGLHRSSNQDSYCALTGRTAPRGADAFIAVADGMGGHRAGEVASAMAIEKLVSRLSRGGRRVSLSPIAAADGWLGEEVQHVNLDLHRAASDPELHGMGTTLTAALLAGDNLYLAHVGDSRAYRLRGGKIQQLTRDHSWVAEQVEAGLLTPDEAREHPRRNILTRALGTALELEVDSAVTTVLAGDRFLLCSDGLHTLVTDDEIARIMAAPDPRQACEALVERANALGGHDNITAIVLHVDTVPPDGEPKRSRARHQPVRSSTFMTPVRALARLSRGISRKGPQSGPGDTGNA